MKLVIMVIFVSVLIDVKIIVICLFLIKYCWKGIFFDLDGFNIIWFDK